MALYALLILPSANRVYAEASVELTQAELRAFDRGVLGNKLAAVQQAQVGGVPYVTFEADELGERDVAVLGNLSSVYALFEIVQGDLLRPVEMRRLDRFDDDLITIQKYQGKTNEQFTKLLLNVTLLASDWAGELLERRFRVLDPLCGRGTTLNQALMYGFDAAGVDRDQKDFEAYATFIQTWLKRKRVKHKAEFGPVRRERQVVAKRLRIELAADRDDFKSGATQLLDVVNVDTMRSREFFKDATFDLIVTDAPYGVQHGSRTAGKGLVRSPEDLLAEAAPIWTRLLRPGGAMGIAWNTFVAKRELAAGLLEEAGLEVVDVEPYGSFRHRVDQAIMRDVLVARKPA
ncbi:TRM11 family SAM-dependent methyltransferase [Dactylosporangium sp. CS-047395]|uniref:TRM11 family SAM-dependent methyltransferase n=1 Tax=Dactylosporangium sp. CS-047395 TaxID=3239936 RepID=UPI003D8EF9A4